MKTQSMRFWSLLSLALFVAAPAFAQDAENPPAAATPLPEKETDYDTIRMRGGFGFHGGLGVVDTGTGTQLTGPAFGFSGRIGVQFFRYVSVIYQNMPVGMVLLPTNAVIAGFMDMNTFMVNGTLLDMFELGTGPSVDYAAVAALSGLAVVTNTGVGAGWHARFALAIGGRDTKGGRRSGFSLAVDGHTSIPTGALILTAGVGGEWF